MKGFERFSVWQWLSLMCRLHCSEARPWRSLSGLVPKIRPKAATSASHAGRRRCRVRGPTPTRGAGTPYGRAGVITKPTKAQSLRRHDCQRGASRRVWRGGAHGAGRHEWRGVRPLLALCAQQPAHQQHGAAECLALRRRGRAVPGAYRAASPPPPPPLPPPCPNSPPKSVLPP